MRRGREEIESERKRSDSLVVSYSRNGKFPRPPHLLVSLAQEKGCICCEDQEFEDSPFSLYLSSGATSPHYRTWIKQKPHRIQDSPSSCHRVSFFPDLCPSVTSHAKRCSNPKARVSIARAGNEQGQTEGYSWTEALVDTVKVREYLE